MDDMGVAILPSRPQYNRRIASGVLLEGIASGRYFGSISTQILSSSIIFPAVGYIHRDYWVRHTELMPWNILNLACNIDLARCLRYQTEPSPMPETSA